MIEHLRGRCCGKYPIEQRGRYECDLCPRRSDDKRDLCFAIGPKKEGGREPSHSDQL